MNVSSIRNTHFGKVLFSVFSVQSRPNHWEFQRLLRTFDTLGCIFLDSGVAHVFSQDSLRDTTDDLRESMYDMGTVAMDLNEKQKERLARKAREEKERK